MKCLEITREAAFNACVDADYARVDATHANVSSGVQLHPFVCTNVVLNDDIVFCGRLDSYTCMEMPLCTMENLHLDIKVIRTTGTMLVVLCFCGQPGIFGTDCLFVCRAVLQI